MDRAVPGGMVTTTGGRGDVDLTAPVERVADGDDIEVLPDLPRSTSRARMRAFLVGGIAAVLVATAITVALANNDHKGANRLRSVSRVHTPPKTPVTQKRVVATTAPKPHVTAPAPRVAATVPTTAVGAAPVSPPPATPSTAPAAIVPTEEPPSVLTWQATPAALTIKAGSHASFSVSVTNPTDGTVTLGVPLSCPAALQTKSGTGIAGVMCPQMAQVMSPHQTLTQQYTVYATDSGDASGAALQAGSYVARVENLYSVSVTITK